MWYYGNGKQAIIEQWQPSTLHHKLPYVAIPLLPIRLYHQALYPPYFIFLTTHPAWEHSIR